MDIDSLRKMVGTARDSAMLRLSLAKALAEPGQTQAEALDEARSHLEAALEMDHSYTAAWKELGKIHLASDDPDGAARAWMQGIETARNNGDKQAEKEMAVFLRRLQRKS